MDPLGLGERTPERPAGCVARTPIGRSVGDSRPEEARADPTASVERDAGCAESEHPAPRAIRVLSAEGPRAFRIGVDVAAQLPRQVRGGEAPAGPVRRPVRRPAPRGRRHPGAHPRCQLPARPAPVAVGPALHAVLQEPPAPLGDGRPRPNRARLYPHPLRGRHVGARTPGRDQGGSGPAQGSRAAGQSAWSNGLLQSFIASSLVAVRRRRGRGRVTPAPPPQRAAPSGAPP